MSELTPEQLACDTNDSYTHPKYQGSFTMTQGDSVTEPVTHGEFRALAMLVESLVTRVDGLQEQVAMLEKRPVVKSRAEYMRNYRKKVVSATPIPADQLVSDTPRTFLPPQVSDIPTV